MAGHRSLDPAVVVRIHPGQSLQRFSVASVACGSYVLGMIWAAHCKRSVVPALLLVVASSGGWLDAVEGQVVTGGSDTTTVVVEPGSIVERARAAQAQFERRRLRLFPLSLGGTGGTCDEHVGRFCTWYGEGEWYPVPEDEKIVEMRRELIALLDSLQSDAPSSEWILGQRVWYRSEGGAWEAARRAAEACGAMDSWWCLALEGFALHGLGRFEEAERTFARALEQMDPDRAQAWAFPRWAVDSDTRRLFDDADDDAARRHLREQMWSLADPLYLVPGNDRLTAHFARRTAAALRDGARNPFRIRWGRDLDELTIRHGWEVGWERSPARDFSTLDNAIGHKHPEGREYMPPGKALQNPARANVEDLRPDRRRPRSLYSPEYAPVLLPMESQFAVFPRGRNMVLVSTHFLPDDTTYHSGHAHALPWLEPGSQRGQPDEIGLFALPLTGTDPIGTRARGVREGALRLEVPTEAYVVSLESWNPDGRRAGRQRFGLEPRAAPEDVATLSDVLILRPTEYAPATLEAALEYALPRAQILPGQTFAIGWEVVGLGFRPEALYFELSVHRTDRGVLRRVGEFLRLSNPPQPLALSWEEAGPGEPAHVFRYLDLDLPVLAEGEYELNLVLKTANRSDAVTRKRFRVSAAR